MRAGHGVGVDVVGLARSRRRRWSRRPGSGPRPAGARGWPGSTAATSPTKPRSGSRGVGRDEAGVLAATAPTASGPWTLMADDDVAVDLADAAPCGRCRAVSASVTRRPSRNSGSLPSRAMRSPIWGPPPCTTTGRMPDGVHQHDVLGEAVGQVRVDHGVAAVLHDDGGAEEAPDVGQRLDEDAGPLGRRAESRPAASAGRVGAHGYTPAIGRPVVSGRPASRLAHCSAWPDGALDQVVDGADGHDRAGALVVAGGDVGHVGAERGLGGRRAAR